MRSISRKFRSALVLILLLDSSWAEMPILILPTDNEAILNSREQDFFMYVDRHFEGVSSKPWTAGRYGFVRNLKRISTQSVIGTRFHEGADIKPMKRDVKGRPLDEVRAVASGRVAYINNSATSSNYGKYIVVLHDWGEGPIYSLYAHLSSTFTTVGQLVESGDTIGLLGYTGVGITKARAHLHFEIGLMLSDNFNAWSGNGESLTAGHGNFNGRNLAGLDAIRLIREQKEGSVNSVKQFLLNQKRHFSVTVRSADTEGLLSRYPWLLVMSEHAGKTDFHEISFSASGLPLYVTASRRTVSQPTLTYLRTTIGFHQDRTQKRLIGSGKTARFSKSGRRYLALILERY